MTISATTQGIKPGVCLSTAKPANPFDGQVIYMTDVDQTAVWDGTQWTVLSPIAGGRNTIINGAMQVDQRSATTTTNGYTVDRWYVEHGSDAVLSSQQSTDVPTGQGFNKSLKVTATTADASIGASQFAVITQHIEGSNSAQLAWGAAGAKPVAVSFWVKATVTGTYSFTLYNDGASRICPSSYTVNASNTWEKKTVYIVGDSSGTWLTTTGRGVVCNFYIALGTNYLGTSGVWNGSSIYGVTGQANALASTSNIFAITGVQLEVGSVATPFEFEDYGTTLAKCQRYFERIQPLSGYQMIATGFVTATTTGAFCLFYETKRAAPTSITFSSAGTFCINNSPDVATTVTSISINASRIGTKSANIHALVASGLTVGQGCHLNALNTPSSTNIDISAEL